MLINYFFLWKCWSGAQRSTCQRCHRDGKKSNKLRNSTPLPNSNMIITFYEFFYFGKLYTKISTSICESPLVSLAMRVKSVEDRVPLRIGLLLMLKRHMVKPLKMALLLLCVHPLLNQHLLHLPTHRTELPNQWMPIYIPLLQLVIILIKGEVRGVRLSGFPGN